MKKMVQEMV